MFGKPEIPQLPLLFQVQTKKTLWAKDTPTDQKFSAVFDANGVETTQESYNHTAQGKLKVIYPKYSEQ